LAQQFVLASQIANEMDRDFAALKQVQSLREQLKELKSKPDVANLADAISSLDARAAALEGKTEERFSAPPRTEKEPQDLTRLNHQLEALLGVVQHTDAAPTSQALATHDELKRALEALLANWTELRKRDLSALNEQLKGSKLGEIDQARLGM